MTTKNVPSDGLRRIGARRAKFGAAALALSVVLLQSACGGRVEVENPTTNAAAGASSESVTAPNGTSTVPPTPTSRPSPTPIPAAGGAGGRDDGSAGSPSSVGARGGSAGAPSNNVDLPGSIALTPTDGWINGTDNVLQIQGAVFSFADPTSTTHLKSDFAGSNACIKGTAARVDLTCTPVAPATDCYGTFFGAAIGINLNQPIDPDGGGTPAPFDASGLNGFSFEVDGPTIPAPSSLRFQVVSSDETQYCNVPSKKVGPGANVFLFSDLVAECFKITTDPPNPSAVTVESQLLRIEWQVVTNTSDVVPYDFCVSNVRALVKPTYR